MSEHKKLARLAARAFYRHSSTKARLARTGNAKHDNSAIAEVLIDALTRRTWVKEEELARQKAELIAREQHERDSHMEAAGGAGGDDGGETARQMALQRVQETIDERRRGNACCPHDDELVHDPGRCSILRWRGRVLQYHQGGL